MSSKKGEGTISGAIILMGALAVAMMTIFIAWNLTSKTRYPGPDKDYLNGTEKEVGSFIAKHVNKCWEEHGMGSSSVREDDCILLKVKSSGNLTSENVKKHINYPELEEKLSFSGIPSNFNATLKIVYKGRKGTVEVRKFY